jgi:hypothetical protein
MSKLSILDNHNIFDAPVPGQSLTDTPKQWQWESPAEISDPVEAYESILESIKRPVATETIQKLLYVGVSVETIVNGLSLKGFSEGKFSPDVAEMIKIPLAFQVTAIGNKAGITPTILNEPPTKPMSDRETVNLLKKFKPSEYNKVAEKLLEDDERQDIEEQKSFMNMEIERGD